MTNLDALKATIGFNIDSTDQMATKAMIDHEITASDEYALENRPSLDKAAIDLLVGMKQIDSISSNGFSIKFNQEEAAATIAYLCARNGISNPLFLNPTVKGVSVW